jgi:hypothetical protein
MQKIASPNPPPKEGAFAWSPNLPFRGWETVGGEIKNRRKFPPVQIHSSFKKNLIMIVF